MNLTPEQRAKLEELFARGLTKGIGDEGQTCIEGAISIALYGTLGDKPACVAGPDRAFAIRLNDSSYWPSPQVRAETLFPLAICQIGTAGTSRKAWAKAVVLGTIRRVLPLALEAVGLVNEAAACRSAKDLKEARRAADAADAAAADADAAAYAYAYAYAAAHAAYAADAYAAAADADASYAYAADAAAATATATAAAYAATATTAAAASAAYVYAAADAKTSEAILREAAAVALDAYAAEGRTP